MKFQNIKAKMKAASATKCATESIRYTVKNESRVVLPPPDSCKSAHAYNKIFTHLPTFKEYE